MTDVPADVMTTAREAVASAFEAHGGYTPSLIATVRGGDGDHFLAVKIAASVIQAERARFVADFDGAADAGIDAAIAAERERCAGIVNDWESYAERMMFVRDVMSELVGRIRSGAE